MAPINSVLHQKVMAAGQVRQCTCSRSNSPVASEPRYFILDNDVENNGWSMRERVQYAGTMHYMSSTRFMLVSCYP